MRMMLCSLVGSDDDSMSFKLEVSDIARLVCLESDPLLSWSLGAPICLRIVCHSCVVMAAKALARQSMFCGKSKFTVAFRLVFL